MITNKKVNEKKEKGESIWEALFQELVWRRACCLSQCVEIAEGDKMVWGNGDQGTKSNAPSVGIKVFEEVQNRRGSCSGSRKRQENMTEMVLAQREGRCKVI